MDSIYQNDQKSLYKLMLTNEHDVTVTFEWDLIYVDEIYIMYVLLREEKVNPY